MREYLFRGKRVSNGEWVYGSLLVFDEETYICVLDKNHEFMDKVQVVPETVGQYIGLTGKNRKKIFEGDMVKILYTDWGSKAENDTRTMEEYLDSLTQVGKVFYFENTYCLRFENERIGSIYCGKYGYIEVIGTVYDMPFQIKEIEL